MLCRLLVDDPCRDSGQCTEFSACDKRTRLCACIEGYYELERKCYKGKFSLFHINVVCVCVLVCVYSVKAAFHPCVIVYIYKPINRSE